MPPAVSGERPARRRSPFPAADSSPAVPPRCVMDCYVAGDCIQQLVLDHGHAGPHQPFVGSVLAPMAIFKGNRYRPGRQLSGLGERCLNVIGMHKFDPMLAHHLRGGIAERCFKSSVDRVKYPSKSDTQTISNPSVKNRPAPRRPASCGDVMDECEEDPFVIDVVRETPPAQPEIHARCDASRSSPAAGPSVRHDPT